MHLHSDYSSSTATVNARVIDDQDDATSPPPTSARVDTAPSSSATPDLNDDPAVVRTPIPYHIDLAGNTSYHIAASRTVTHGCRLTMARDRLRLLAYVYDSVASIHMTENPGRHG